MGWTVLLWVQRRGQSAKPENRGRGPEMSGRPAALRERPGQRGRRGVGFEANAGVRGGVQGVERGGNGADHEGKRAEILRRSSRVIEKIIS